MGARAPRRVPRRLARVVVAAVVVASILPSALRIEAAGASPRAAEATVLVNTQSAGYNDFVQLVRPYLTNFGIAFQVIDIATATVPADLTDRAVIVVGHRGLDNTGTLLDASEQQSIVTAVSAGTGLVSFDDDLAVSNADRYSFMQQIWHFTYQNRYGFGAFATIAVNNTHWVSARQPGPGYFTRAPISGQSVAVPSGAMALVFVPVTPTQPIAIAGSFGQGRMVQWTTADLFRPNVFGQFQGLDDIVWRGIVWAARKPFVMRGMPPFISMRIDDATGTAAGGPFNYVTIANNRGFKPFVALFIGQVDATEAAILKNLVLSGNATTSAHATDMGVFLYFDHAAGTPYPDSRVATIFANIDSFFATMGIAPSKIAVPHYYETGTNVYQAFADRGYEFVDVALPPGYPYAASTPPLVVGPYRNYGAPGNNTQSFNLFAADWLQIAPGNPLNGRFFNWLTEIRQGADDYDFKPTANVTTSVASGTDKLRRALDQMAMPTLFLHEQNFAAGNVTGAIWDQILAGITANIAGYNPQYVTLDDASRYVRATRTSALTGATINAAGDMLTVAFTGAADVATKFWVFNGPPTNITGTLIDVPAFTAGTAVNTPISSDVVAPSSAITAPTNGQAITSPTFTITGNASDNTGGSGLWRVEVSTNGGSTWQLATGTSSWSYSWSPTQGSYVIRSRATDNAGNVEVPGPGVSVTVADTTPPTLSGTGTTLIGLTTATVTWTTSEPANTQVEYGATASYGTTSALDATLATSHSVSLVGLAPGQLYHYRARSRDAAGNLGLSGDLTFTTGTGTASTSLALSGTAYAEAPNTSKLNLLGDWTVEAWFKDETPGGGFNHSVSYIAIKGDTNVNGEAPYLVGVQWNSLFAGVRTGWSSNIVSAPLGTTNATAWHHVAASFASGTRQLTLYLDGAQVAQGILAARTTTGNGVALDIGRNGSTGQFWRGKIDDVRLWNVVRSGADIAANYTRELASSPASLIANWKFDDAVGTVAVDSSAPPQNANLIGGATWSSDVANTPPPPDTTAPVITGVGSSGATSASVNIAWTTDEPADGQVEYGTTIDYGSLSVLATPLVTSHTQALAGLSADSTYHYRVRSRDGAGNLAMSSDRTFATAPPDTAPPTFSGGAPTSLTNTTATIAWTTNEPADSQIEYGADTLYGAFTPLDATFVTSHTQTLTGLAPNTTYHYRMRGRDTVGNLGLSGDLVFTTTNAAPVNSLLLGAPGAYAEAPNAAELNVVGDWTVEAWFKDENAAGFNHDIAYIAMKGNTDANSEAPFLVGVQWNTVFAGGRTGWANQTISAPIGLIGAGAWHHVAATFVASTRQLTIYIDGAQVVQGTLAARTTAGNTLPVEIGRNGNGGGLWRGKIDDVRVWNVARTAAEVSSAYRSQLATAPASLVGNWKFDEGLGTSAADSTATPQNATLSAPASWSPDIHP
jgi:concanavalin A-like lectin/glucanase superfamily protein/purple acid phosphatase-like protein